MYYQSFHGHPMSGGMIARGDRNVFRFIEENSLLRAGAVDMPPLPFPNNANQALAELAEANIGFLIIDKALLNAAFSQGRSLLDVADWREAMSIEPIFEDEMLLVFATSKENLP
jgi:hypothetical protein